MEDNRPGYYAIIPANVRYDDRIPANAKLLYGEISALIGTDGFCFATNPYFAQIYKCSEDSVSRWISALEKHGYIKREIVRDKSGQIVQRKMFLTVSIPDIQPSGKISDTPPQNFREGVRKNAEDTNTSITSIEKKSKKEKKPKAEPLTEDQLRQYWIDWITENAGEDWPRKEKNELFYALMAFYEPRETEKKQPSQMKTACVRIGHLLMNLSKGSPPRMVELLDRATSAGWKSIYPGSGYQNYPADREQEETRWL